MKRYGMVLAMLLALPGMANAWYLNAKSANTTQGTVSPSGSVYIAPGVSSAEYTVTPKTTAYKISKVTLDGAVLPANGNGKYVAPYDAAKGYRYLIAYFTANVNLYNITTSAGANGAVYEDTYESLTNIPAGASRQILVVPNTGYTATVTASAGGVVTDAGNGKQLVTFDALAADQSVSATFALTPVFNVGAGVNQTLPSYNTVGYVTGSVDTNLGAATYTWSSQVRTATSNGVTTTSQLVFDTPNAISSAFRISATTSNGSPAAFAKGTYTITLTAVAGGQTKVSAPITITFLDGKAANLNVCTACHSNNTPEFVASYVAGAHGAASGKETGTCQRCHATTGAQVGFAQGWVGDYTKLMADQATVWNPNQPLISDNGISCAVCHNAHDGLNAVTGWDPNANQVNNDQYDVCTACHTLTDNAGALVGNYHDGGSINVTRSIADSHFDSAATGFGLATNKVEGYVVRTNGATPCADCHNVHTGDITVQEEWAESGHAGKIATAKADAACAESLTWYNALVPTNTATACTDSKTAIVPPATTASTRTVLEFFQRHADGVAFYKTAGSTTTTGADPWIHYNWDQTSSRGTCQKCHTATGAANYMDAPATYSPANNDFSHLAGWTAAAGSAQQEVLYCWGCHNNAGEGTLRNPGAVKADYKFQGATAVYPDVQASNTCLVCHIGQASGNSITDLTAASNTFTNQSFINSHYMAAGSLMYVKGGYTNFVPANTQVPGTTGTGIVSYGQTLTSTADMTVDVNGVAVAGKLSSTHRKLGTTAINGYNSNPLFVPGFLDSDGPCVTCHYANGDHTLEMGQVALTAVCTNCHAAEAPDAAGLATFIEEEGAAPFQAALTLALSKLSANYNITYNQSTYPYFYDASAANGAVKNWTRSNFLATALSAADAEKLMGAAFNINLLKRDPAAHAHARTYARRLLYDSIDFLDDGIMNLSTGATALASGLKDALGNDVFVKGPTATDPTTTEAAKYLIGYNRTTGAWNASERP